MRTDAPGPVVKYVVISLTPKQKGLKTIEKAVFAADVLQGSDLAVGKYKNMLIVPFLPVHELQADGGRGLVDPVVAFVLELDAEMDLAVFGFGDGLPGDRPFIGEAYTTAFEGPVRHQRTIPRTNALGGIDILYEFGTLPAPLAAGRVNRAGSVITHNGLGQPQTKITDLARRFDDDFTGTLFGQEAKGKGLFMGRTSQALE